MARPSPSSLASLDPVEPFDPIVARLTRLHPKVIDLTLERLLLLMLAFALLPGGLKRLESLLNLALLTRENDRKLANFLSQIRNRIFHSIDSFF